MRAWGDLTDVELDTFIGLRFLMGIDKKAEQRMYWNILGPHYQPIFPENMARDRFEAIQHMIHFADNEEDRVEEDRVWKLRTVIDLLNYQCSTVYIPRQIVSVDESLWNFKGRLGFRQFNPSKRARYGVKVYKLSESTGRAAGYTSAFKIYTGQDKTTKDTNVSMKVVSSSTRGTRCIPTTGIAPQTYSTTSRVVRHMTLGPRT